MPSGVTFLQTQEMNTEKVCERKLQSVKFSKQKNSVLDHCINDQVRRWQSYNKLIQCTAKRLMDITQKRAVR